MDDFRELYRRIEYLRNNGIKMKEIADCAGMAPSILSSLYTTVLPTYFEELKNCSHEEALDHAIVLVNNISKRRLLSILPELLERLGKGWNRTCNPTGKPILSSTICKKKYCFPPHGWTTYADFTRVTAFLLPRTA